MIITQQEHKNNAVSHTCTNIKMFSTTCTKHTCSSTQNRCPLTDDSHCTYPETFILHVHVHVHYECH